MKFDDPRSGDAVRHLGKEEPNPPVLVHEKDELIILAQCTDMITLDRQAALRVFERLKEFIKGG